WAAPPSSGAALDGYDDGFAGRLAEFAEWAPVVFGLPDVAVCVKDVRARDAVVKRSLAQRCGCLDEREQYGPAADVGVRRGGGGS
ncbi:hypothetical protein AAHH80_34885, partial [Burkholderia pseudomallei]